MLDDRDHRPPPTPHLPLYRADVAARLHTNERLARIDTVLTEREPPSRFGLLLVLLAVGLVALGFVFAAFLDQVLIPMTVAVLS